MAIEDNSGARLSTGADSLLREIAAAPPQPVADIIDQVLDERYRIESLLGRGGMGAVYLATHLGTGRTVALKVLVPELTANEDAVERFRREAQAAGRVRHPNVVDVTDFGFAVMGNSRRAYLVMEHLRGETLRARLEASGPLPLDVAVEVLAQICAGVAEAHALNVLHRDLKPENIHLEPGARGHYRVRVLDFGIAKLLGPGPGAELPPVAPGPALPDADPSLAPTLLPLALEAPNASLLGAGESALTAVGALIGTPRYMAPEQWMGQQADVRTDVYSLGVLAYEILVGEPPFVGKGRSIALEHRVDSPPRLAEKVPLVPRRIARVIESALAKDASERPQSVSAFAAVLQAGTETTGKLIRRSVALCLEHFWLFFRPSLILQLPVLLIALTSLASGLLAHRGFISSRADTWLGVLPVRFSTLLTFPMSVALIGLIVPLTLELDTGGRAQRPPISEFWRILRRSFPSSLVKLGILAGVPALVLLPIVKAAHLNTFHLPTTLALLLAQPALGYTAIAPFILTGPIVAAEGLRGFAPLRRSASLVRPVLGIAIGVLLLWHFLAMATHIFFDFAVAAITNTPLEDALAGMKRDLLSSTLVRVAGVLDALLSLVLLPFYLPLGALLYLRAREAEGDPARL
jgi:serine/threonine protein kinase